MANPHTPPSTQKASAETPSFRLAVIRGVSFGVGASGTILCCLHFFLPLSAALSARCEILGGALLVVASVGLLIVAWAKRFGLTRRARMITMSVAFLFCILGCGWSATGFATLSSQREAFSAIKPNLEGLSDAINAYEQRQGGSTDEGD